MYVYNKKFVTMERMVRPSNISNMAEGSFINHGITNDLTK